MASRLNRQKPSKTRRRPRKPSLAFPPTAVVRGKIVVDNIHGEIELSPHEWRVVNTATFQRLRSLKQLGMGHLVYPNATHNRFAHSLGVFGIMRRILGKLREQGRSPKMAEEENLRLAALLHDIGHYPYSHLMERVDFVQRTEDELGKRALVKLQRRESFIPIMKNWAARFWNIRTMCVRQSAELIAHAKSAHYSRGWRSRIRSSRSSSIAASIWTDWTTCCAMRAQLGYPLARSTLIIS